MISILSGKRKGMAVDTPEFALGGNKGNHIHLRKSISVRMEANLLTSHKFDANYKLKIEKTAEIKTHKVIKADL